MNRDHTRHADTGWGTAGTGDSDLVRLKLMWLASPALPVGGFSYSEGLEAAVEAGVVRDEATAGQWLQSQLAVTVARAELPAVAQAHRCWADGDGAGAAAVNDWVRTTRETSELRLQSEQMGRSLLEWVRHQYPDDARPQTCVEWPAAPCWPTAFGLATALAGASPRDAVLACGFSWAENQIQAAIKAVPLGQTAGQRLLRVLAEQLAMAVDDALSRRDASQRQAFSPMLAIRSSQHEAQYSRLFRS